MLLKCSGLEAVQYRCTTILKIGNKVTKKFALISFDLFAHAKH